MEWGRAQWCEPKEQLHRGDRGSAIATGADPELRGAEGAHEIWDASHVPHCGRAVKWQNLLAATSLLTHGR